MHVNGKQVKSSFKVNNQFFTNRALQLLYMDLFGPMRVSSLGGKILHLLLLMIALLCQAFSKFCKRVQNEKKKVLFPKLKVIMVENLTILLLKIVLTMNFLLLKLHNKMELCKERIILFKKWKELR
jgi:cytochrome c biogenesis factor